MKATVDVDDLARELTVVFRAIDKAATIPILKNVLIEAGKHGLVLSATDLTVSIRTTLHAQVSQEGSAAVPAIGIMGLAKSLSGEATLEVADGGWLQIDCAGSKAKLPGLATTDYPAIASRPKTADCQLPTGKLLELVKKVQYAAAAKDAGRYFTTCLHLVIAKGAMSLVATDGSRLVMGKAEIQHEGEDVAYSVPVRAAQALLGMEARLESAVSVALDGGHLFFWSGETMLSCTTPSDDHFPAYEKIVAVPERFTELAVQVKPLQAALRRLALVANNGIATLTLSLAGLSLAAESVDRGHVTELVPLTEAVGKNLNTGFGVSFLSEFLATVGVETVTLAYGDAETPLHFWPAGAKGTHHYALMPCRL